MAVPQITDSISTESTTVPGHLFEIAAVSQDGVMSSSRVGSGDIWAAGSMCDVCSSEFAIPRWQRKSVVVPRASGRTCGGESEHRVVELLGTLDGYRVTRTAEDHQFGVGKPFMHVASTVHG